MQGLIRQFLELGDPLEVVGLRRDVLAMHHQRTAANLLGRSKRADDRVPQQRFADALASVVAVNGEPYQHDHRNRVATAAGGHACGRLIGLHAPRRDGVEADDVVAAVLCGHHHSGEAAPV